MLSNTRTSWSMFHRWNVSLWLSVILPAQRSSWAWLNITIFYTLFELWFTIWITWDFCFLLNEDLAVLIESREVSAKVTGTHFLQVEWYCLHIQKIQHSCLYSQPFFWQKNTKLGETSNVPFFCTSFTLMKCCCLPRRSLEIKYISTHVQISWSLKQRESNGFQGLYQC